MGGFLHVFVIGVFACLLSIHNASCDPLVFKYEISSLNYIDVNPQLSETIVRINTDMIAEYNASDPNSFYLALRNTQITVEKIDGTTIVLNKCSSMSKSNVSFLKPFRAVYDDGFLRYVTVYDSESELSVNLKLIITIILQLKESVLKGTSYKTKYNEPIHFGGTCPVTYNTDLQKKSADSEFYRSDRDFDMSLCCDLKNVNINEISCLKTTCTNDPQLEWNRQVNATMIKSAAGIFVDMWTVGENITFLPWIDSAKQADIKTLTTIIDVPGDYSAISPQFSDVSTVDASKFWFRDVNIPIFKEKKNEDLFITYRALACQSNTQNLLMDIYEKVINCEKI